MRDGLFLHHGRLVKTVWTEAASRAWLRDVYCAIRSFERHHGSVDVRDVRDDVALLTQELEEAFETTSEEDYAPEVYETYVDRRGIPRTDHLTLQYGLYDIMHEYTRPDNTREDFDLLYQKQLGGYTLCQVQGALREHEGGGNYLFVQGVIACPFYGHSLRTFPRRPERDLFAFTLAEELVVDVLHDASEADAACVQIDPVTWNAPWYEKLEALRDRHTTPVPLVLGDYEAVDDFFA